MTASIGEGDLRSADQVADGARHEDLAGLDQRRNLGRPADGDASAGTRTCQPPERVAWIHAYDTFALA